MKMFLVGGAVRDSFLGTPSKDRDFAVEGETFASMLANIERMVAKPSDVFEIRPEFNTVRANVPSLGAADFVLCRKDGQYTDGRRPDSVEAGTIFDDLARRDFTMNAIAINVDTGEVVDPFNGRADIEKRIINAVGNATDRFSEDSLRMLRAVRFAVTKHFTMSQDVETALRTSALIAKLDNVSVERIREELERAFKFDTLATLQTLRQFPGLEAKIFNGKNGLRLSATMKA